MREVNLVMPERNIQTRMRKYNETYRLKHSHLVTCACGATFKEISKYSHVKSGVHKTFVDNTNGGVVNECGSHDNGSCISIVGVEVVSGSTK
jgi:hypothetical protein